MQALTNDLGRVEILKRLKEYATVNLFAFYGGIILISIAVFYWLFKPTSPAQKNAIEFPGGLKFDLSTPAFVLIAFGIILMLISRQFPEQVGLKPPPEIQHFDVSGPVARFGCEENATASVTYDPPPGWRIISATAHIGTNTGDVKNQNANVTKQDSNHVEVEATFQGRDRNLGIDCPSGGHGQAQVTGKIQRD